MKTTTIGDELAPGDLAAQEMECVEPREPRALYRGDYEHFTEETGACRPLCKEHPPFLHYIRYSSIVIVIIIV